MRVRENKDAFLVPTLRLCFLRNWRTANNVCLSDFKFKVESFFTLSGVGCDWDGETDDAMANSDKSGIRGIIYNGQVLV